MKAFTNRLSTLSLHIFLCLLAAPTFGQADTLTLSGEWIERGIEYRNDGELKRSEEAFLQVPEADTNYLYMITELALTYQQMKAYPKMREVLQPVIADHSEYRLSLNLKNAASYLLEGNYKTAKQLYIDLAKEYPNNYLVHYNLGLVNLNLGAFGLARKHFHKTVKLNPFYSNSHYMLAELLLREGFRTQAALSMGFFLALNSSNNQALVFLNRLLNSANPNEPVNLYLGRNDPYHQIDLLLRSRYALGENIESAFELSAPVVRQFELIIDQLTPVEDKSIISTAYAPFYLEMKEEGYDLAFLHHIFSSAPSESIKTWINNHEEEMNGFYQLANRHLTDLRKRDTATVNGIKDIYAFRYYDSHELESIGNESADGLKIGPWRSFHANGEVSSFGSYKAEGEKTGLWKYFHKNGRLHYEENYQGGNIQGKVALYDENGHLSYRINYLEGQLDGPVEIYYPCGQLSETLTYTSGKRNGPGEGFHRSGERSVSYTFKNDLLQGSFTRYFPNQQIDEKLHYDSGLINGPYESYYHDGQLAENGQYREGLKVGKWTGYHPNGKVSYQGVFDGGNKEGSWLHYNRDGKLESEENYRGGLVSGTQKHYADGQLHYRLFYRNDTILAYAYFDQGGDIVDTDSSKAGNFTYRGYTPEGRPFFEVAIANGQRSGLYKGFYPSGQLFQEYHYRDGQLAGGYREYYENGQLKNAGAYGDEGAEHGRYVSYAENGQKEAEGFVDHGDRGGWWITYHPNGAPADSSYYLDGYTMGRNPVYDQEQRISEVYSYSREGQLREAFQIDALGNVYHRDTIGNLRGNLHLQFLNEKRAYQVGTYCGQNISDKISFYPNGQIASKLGHRHGITQGKYQKFYATGTVELDGQYLQNVATGHWKWFYPNGNKETDGYYLNDDRDSLWTYYYPNGAKDGEYQYSQGERHGASYHYEPGGQLQAILHYERGLLVAFQYNGENGELSDKQILESGNGKVTAYYQNGQISMDRTYRNNGLDGRVTEYYPSGKVLKESFYENNLREGVQKRYHANGNVEEEVVFVNDLRDGIEKHFDRNGKLIYSMEWQDGLREGREIFFNDVKPLLSVFYRSDEPYEVK